MKRRALAAILDTEHRIRDLTLSSYRRWSVAARGLVLPVFTAAAQPAQPPPEPVEEPVIPPDVAALAAAYILWSQEMDGQFLPGLGQLLDGLVAAALAGHGLLRFDYPGRREPVDAADATRVVPMLTEWRAAFLAAVRERMAGTPATVQRDLQTTLDQHTTATVAQLRQVAADELTVRPGTRWDHRADTVARTEATAAYNAAQQAAGRLAHHIATTAGESVGYEKMWMSLHDGRTRPTHTAADGQRVPLDAAFRVGAADLDYPGDPNGPPHEVVNCRCAVAVIPIADRAPAGHDNSGTTAAAAAPTRKGTTTMARTFEALLMPTGVIGRSGMSMLSPTAVLIDTALPLALKWQPSDEPGHHGGLTIGAIEALELTNRGLIATGTLLDSPDTEAAMQQIQAGVTRPSAELVVREETLVDEHGTTLTPDTADEVWRSGGTVVMRMDKVEIVGGTLVSVPEFRDTTISVSDSEAAAPDLALVAATVVEPDRFDPEMFDNPMLDEPTPIHLTPDGRVVGHLAAWESLHRAIKDRAQHPYRSHSGYAEFHQSHVYLTTGEILRVGRLTVGGGHAPAGRGMRAAVAHYDDVATCWAHVRAGEDEHGIWVSGVVNPHASEAMVKQALGTPHSGHWERVGGHPELIAAHAVNVPGFAICSRKRDHAGDLAMVASFAPRQSRPPVSGTVLDEVARRAVEQYAEHTAARERAVTARRLVAAAAGRRQRILADVIREAAARRGM
ncbi:phage head morphogenesis protein [Nocardia sp. CDC159]|uniref:Phage head morphogenesis protein n=1 Tax=Nocardia pulmonis TaxID=2951408 RepID=A0A9X2ECL3_9NOCA|nr:MULTISPECIES: phage minor head protein [Nocardia]MCM6777920.1 phage head morphogenesis protein [Nocardia pulmonis]MCM6790909.1 phage head morphogenesis protein [Nocardia sp. CDC159]